MFIEMPLLINFAKQIKNWTRREMSWSNGHGSKPLGTSKVYSATHPSKVDHLTTRNSWGSSF